MPECNASHPRIFIYPDSIGTPPWNMQYDARLDFLAARIRSSQFYTADGSCADYFIVHNYVGQYTSSAFVLRTFERIAQSFPHWNRTHQTGLVRHLVISPCDHGPGDCMFDRNGMPALSAGGVVPWSALDPSSARRRIGFLTLNGQLEAPTNFHRGLDIRLPAFDSHQCGPYCGMSHFDKRQGLKLARHSLRRFSPWTGLRAGRSTQYTQHPSLHGRRRWRLFWAGRATKGGARGDLFRFHSARSGFLLHDTSGRFPSSPGAENASADATFFPRAMANSDFCLSPLGQSDGDSDRYLPALLYGCVPIFTSVGEALPFEEVLHWPSFSLRLPNGAKDIERLHILLQGVSDRRLRLMRANMAVAWPRMLWTSVATPLPASLHSSPHGHGRPRPPRENASEASYLGEGPHRDAFAALIAVLRRRLRSSTPIFG